MHEKNPLIILQGITIEQLVFFLQGCIESSLAKNATVATQTSQSDVVTLSELEERLKISSPTLTKVLQKHSIKPIVDNNKCPRYLYSEVLEKLKKDR